MGKADIIMDLALCLASDDIKAGLMFKLPDGFTKLNIKHEDHGGTIDLYCIFTNEIYGCYEVARFLLGDLVLPWYYDLYCKGNRFIIKDYRGNSYLYFKLPDRLTGEIAKAIMLGGVKNA